MYGAAISGEATAQLFYIAGKDDLISADISSATVGESPFVLYHQSNDFTFIPEQRFTDGRLELNVFEGISADGFYNLRLNDTTLQTYAFNFDRNESQMEFFMEDEIELELSTSGLTNFQVLNSADKSFSEIINALQKESELWKLFIIFALLMLLAEVLILRFWK